MRVPVCIVVGTEASWVPSGWYGWRYKAEAHRCQGHCHNFLRQQGPQGEIRSFPTFDPNDLRLVDNHMPVAETYRCYTNHALDQFLEHLLKAGISKIIRVGGQSRSDLLENHNLRNISQSESKTRHEGWQLATAYKKLEEYETSSQRTLGRVHGIGRRSEWKYFQYHLARRYESIQAQFRSDDSSGFTTVGRHPFDLWAASGVPDGGSMAQAGTATLVMNVDSIIQKAIRDVQSLPSAERRVLTEHWIRELRQDAEEECGGRTT